MSLETLKAQSPPNVDESPFWEHARALWAVVQQDKCLDVQFDDLAAARRETQGVKYAQAPDGSVLAYTETGDLNGDPVILHHGTPGSRIGPLPATPVLYRLGVHLITYDRPDYGLSSLGDPEKGMRPSDSATHVEAVADEIGVGEFVVIGRSGGAKHALACLAKLPDRAMAGGVLAGAAPEGVFKGENIDQHAGEAAENIKALTVMTDSEKQQKYTTLARRIRRYGGMAMLGYLDSLLQLNDRRTIVDRRLVRSLMQTYEEGVRCGADGWVRDLAKDWGFDPRSIKQPVKIWHGPHDRTVSPNQAYGLDAMMSGSILEVPSEGTHFTAFPKTIDMIKLVLELAKSKK